MPANNCTATEHSTNSLHNFTTTGNELRGLEIEYDWETGFSKQEDQNADVKETDTSIERDARKLGGIFTVLRSL